MPQKKILIANNYLTGWTGSEITCLDLAYFFREMGYHVQLFGLQIGNPLKSKIESENFLICNTENPPTPPFDYVWAHHPFTYYWLASHFDLCKSTVIYGTLSPFEPLESLPLWIDNINLFVANSKETASFLIDTGINPESIALFPNPVYGLDKFPVASKKTVHRHPLIAVISNYPTKEMLELKNIRLGNFQFEHIGLGGKYELITLEMLAKFDGVITIGRTVQSSLCLGLPVYCYGRFGGPGFLNKNNIADAEIMNFSGRDTPNIKKSKEILIDFERDFNTAKIWAEEYQKEATKKYQLGPIALKILNQARCQSSCSIINPETTFKKCAERHAAAWLLLLQKCNHLENESDLELQRVVNHPISGAIIRLLRFIKRDPTFGNSTKHK